MREHHNQSAPRSSTPRRCSAWSDSDADVIEVDDIFALGAAVYMFVMINLSLLHSYRRTLPELLTEVAELLTRHQPNDFPVWYTARIIQQVTRVEFRILDILELELATLTPAAWVQVFSRRLSPWQQQQLLQQPCLLTVPPAVLAGSAHRTAAHVQSFPFHVGSTVRCVCVCLRCNDRASAPGDRSPCFARASRLARHISLSCCSHSRDASVCVQGTFSVLSFVLATRSVSWTCCPEFAPCTTVSPLRWA